MFLLLVARWSPGRCSTCLRKASAVPGAGAGISDGAAHGHTASSPRLGRGTAAPWLKYHSWKMARRSPGSALQLPSSCFCRGLQSAGKAEVFSPRSCRTRASSSRRSPRWSSQPGPGARPALPNKPTPSTAGCRGLTQGLLGGMRSSRPPSFPQQILGTARTAGCSAFAKGQPAPGLPAPRWVSVCFQPARLFLPRVVASSQLSRNSCECLSQSLGARASLFSPCLLDKCNSCKQGHFLAPKRWQRAGNVMLL